MIGFRFVSACALAAAATLFAADASAQQVLELKPNIRALPAADMAIVPDFFGGFKLVFSATTWNAGSGPLELIAGETGNGRQNVYQRVFLSDGGYYDRLAGTFEWHPSHNHFHFEDYAVYTLQPVDAPGGSERIGLKTTFCVMDTTRIDRNLPGSPRKAVYTTCGPTRQGMSVGWGDTYGSQLPGQEVDVTDLPPGDYRLVIEADPKNRLIETEENADNSSCVLLRLDVASQSVVVLDPDGCEGAGPADVSVSAISPSTVRRGSVTPATITGVGFAPGMAVTFENGSGPQPTASDVVVVNDTTITAIVTARNGGPPRTQVWDVRVGSGVLIDGLTILP